MPIAPLLLATLVTLAAQTPATSNPNPWEDEIHAFEETDRQAPPQPGAILFIGSSSIQRWKDLAQDFPTHRTLNRGFGGSQIADSTHFVDRIVTPYHPSQIVLYAGDNDIAEGRSPDQVRADFDAFVQRVRIDLPEVPIAFISIKPSLKREPLLEQMRDANAQIKQYASEHPNVTYIDVFTPMLANDGKARGELFVDDGLHLNDLGYELWRSIIEKSLRH